MILYTDSQHYDPHYRGELFDLLKPLVGKIAGYTDEARKEEYGISEKDFTLTDDLQIAEIAVLPMTWNYYYSTNALTRALQFIEKAQKSNLKIISSTSGDFGITPKYNASLFVYRQSGYIDKFPKNHKAVPVFIPDPIKEYFNNDETFVLEYNVNRPSRVVGFCGHANGSIVIHLKEILGVLIRNIKSLTGVSHNDTQKIISSSYLRTKILNSIERNDYFTNNFIKRKKYRAGELASNVNRKQTTIEYFNNMLYSDFIVCVRGAGNFSVRFYETLAMGRIPLVFDTYSPLPDIGSNLWDNHIVKVNKGDLKNLPQIVNVFLGNKNMKDIRKSNRELYKSILSRNGFWNNQFNNLCSEK